MLCDICNVKTASIYIQEELEGQSQSLRICRDCATSCNIKIDLASGLSLEQVLENSAFGNSPPGTDNTSDATAECSSCGLTYSEFSKDGRLGCEECYQAFADFLGNTLPTIHKGVAHRGKIIKGPANPCVLEQTLQKRSALYRSLESAIDQENYEKAASIWNQLKGDLS